MAEWADANDLHDSWDAAKQRDPKTGGLTKAVDFSIKMMEQDFHGEEFQREADALGIDTLTLKGCVHDG